MSEYQYFEFQAIDHRLTTEQMAELRRYSTRAAITSTSFVNEYQWGNLKGDPKRWMADYFDAFIHFANWGTHWLMFRLPGDLLATRTVRDYETEDALEVWSAGKHTIVSFTSDTEEPEWEEATHLLASLIPLRSALIRGDLRSLYLAWLSGIHGRDAEDEDEDEDEDEQDLEPPVPPGLADLDGPHQALADFLRVDPDLLTVAAERSAPLRETRLDRAAIAGWVQGLPPAEKDRLVTDLLLSDHPYPLVALRQRVERDLCAVAPADTGRERRRTAAALCTRAAALTRERKEQEARTRAAAKARQEAETAARRQRHLVALSGQEERLWQSIDTLISTRQPASYGQAVTLLQDLRELAAMDQQPGAFCERMIRLCDAHAKKPALIRRFREAGLVDRQP